MLALSGTSADQRESLIWHAGPEAAKAAEICFRQAIRISARQSALSWKLRAAISLAQLLREQGLPADAVACLRPIYGQLREGFDSDDATTARALLEMLPDSLGHSGA
jgi:hypothetical protein